MALLTLPTSATDRERTAVITLTEEVERVRAETHQSRVD
jgi:hypothetical protein